MSRPKGELPRPIFAKIAPHEFLVANLVRPTADDDDNDGTASQGRAQGTRPNGRTPSEARPFDVHTGALSQAHGSAAVRLGRTRVICGVRGEILPVAHIPQYRPSAVPAGASAEAIEADNRRQLGDYDLLVPNLELATGCAPDYLPGGPPSVLAQALSTRLCALLHSSGLMDAEPLKIWHRPKPAAGGADTMDVDEAGDNEDDKDKDKDGDDEDEDEDEDADSNTPQLMAYWTLYIDVVFLSLDGNPFDAAWAAVLAALRSTRLPSARWDADRATVVCSRAKSDMPLALRGLPVASTAVVCVENRKKQQRQSRGAAGAHWVLLDPDRLEESQCRETVTVVVDRGGGGGGGGPTVIRSLSKTGGVLVGPLEVHALVAAAEARWTALSKALAKQT